MAHRDRKRFIEPHIQNALGFSAIVGIIGQRQVGKTTLIEKFSGENYLTLDDDQTMRDANQSPKYFLEHRRSNLPLAIDECQKAPPLFPALKLAVQKNQRPGQFLLSGSIRFTSRKAIQESLTGRIHTLELLPMNVAEAHQQALLDFTRFFSMDQKLFRKFTDNRADFANDSAVEKFLSHGGLPGICFLREQKHRNARFKSHIETLLQRDIRLIVETTVPFENLRLLLTYFAQYQGRPFNASDASRSTQISANTLKKITYAFENMFLIRRLLGVGKANAPRFFLEDQGMASFLTTSNEMGDHVRFAFSQLFAQAHYHYMNTLTIGYYSNPGGADLPLVFDVDGIKYGIEIVLTPAANMSALRSAKSFLENYPTAKVLILAKEYRRYADNILQIPMTSII